MSDNKIVNLESYKPYPKKFEDMTLKEFKMFAQYVVNGDIINPSYVQSMLKMSRRKEILEKHPYAISEGKDGKWRTYVPTKDGRKLIKLSTREKIENRLVEYYESIQEIPKTFEDMYFKWREVQDVLVVHNSSVKYDTDYKRYFQDTDFVKKEIEDINEEDIKLFIVSTVKRLELSKKACKTLFGYINNVFKSARIRRIISGNPMEFLEAKQFYKYCKVTVRPRNKTIITESEMSLLYRQFEEDHKKNPSYIPTYAVEFAALTGMRVGEIAALSWDDITDEAIMVRKSEKYDRVNKSYFVDTTKNSKERAFPITKEIHELLHTVKLVEIKNGYFCEWVFANEEGRIHAPMISSCAKTKCRQVGITEKGIHAFRRTLNSEMRHNGVSPTIAAALLGHTEAVNENYYTFDVSDMEEKRNIIEQINKKGSQANKKVVKKVVKGSQKSRASSTYPMPKTLDFKGKSRGNRI